MLPISKVETEDETEVKAKVKIKNTQSLNLNLNLNLNLASTSTFSKLYKTLSLPQGGFVYCSARYRTNKRKETSLLFPNVYIVR